MIYCIIRLWALDRKINICVLMDVFFKMDRRNLLICMGLLGDFNVIYYSCMGVCIYICIYIIKYNVICMCECV